MPIHMEAVDVSSELEDLQSVLIVSCPICPPMSLAMDTDTPFLEPLRRGVKTKAFEDHIRAIREPLERRGTRTGVFTSRLPCPTMCLWTKGQRTRLLKRAKRYEAVLVLGCDSAAETARKTLAGTDCTVIQAMRATGVANASLGYRLPMTLEFRETTKVDLNGEQ